MVRIACLGLSAVMLGLFLKQVNAPFSALISLAACLLIVFFSVSKLTMVFDLLETVNDTLSGQNSYLRILLKITGITYVADFAANLCRDAGYSAIAGQIEIFGKLSVLAVSAPIVMALLETVYSIF